VSNIAADPANASDPCVTAITGPVNNGTPATVADISNLLACNPPASVPDTCKTTCNASLSKLTDEQITSLMTQCMNDPTFASAFETSNPDIAASIAEAEEANAQGTRPEDLLAGKQFTREEKRQVLLNSLDNQVFAAACSELSLNIQDSPEGIAAAVDAIKNAVLATTDTSLHEEFARLESEFESDPIVLLEKLHNSELLKTAIADVVKTNATNGLDALSPEGLDQLFESCANDPALAGILVASNAELSNELANVNDAEAIFNPVTGEKVNPDEPITEALLSQIMNLNVVTPGTEWSVQFNSNLICTGSTLEDRTNPNAPEVYGTIGQLMEKFGKSIFDKAISAQAAQIVKDDLAIAADAQRLSETATMLNTSVDQGATSETTDALEFTIGSIQADIKQRLNDVFDTDISTLTINTCKTLKSKVDMLQSKSILDDFIPSS